MASFWQVSVQFMQWVSARLAHLSNRLLYMASHLPKDQPSFSTWYTQGSKEQQERTSPNGQAPFKPLLMSCLLVSHWTMQVTHSSLRDSEKGVLALHCCDAEYHALIPQTLVLLVLTCTTTIVILQHQMQNNVLECNSLWQYHLLMSCPWLYLSSTYQ